ncbi:MAG TPA: hypothetical protein VKZ18_19615 [Polyangia bacterium]|nr:hypothetical protein [Polyangia bacterium]
MDAISQPRSLNAKVGAIGLAASAFLTLLLSHFSATLAPLRLLCLALSAFAAWCFCDEMGMRKPLNRAGFVLFVIAVAVKVQAILGVSARDAGRYYLLFAAFLLLALMFWSVAFLHRQRSVKVVGAVGVVVSVVPIAALIAGHLAVGTGAFLGIKALLAAGDGAVLADRSFVTLVERLFGLWAYVAAWLMWRGHLVSPSSRA